jgi:glycosyltransferase involved in cell wall biosynthesis
VKNILIIHPEGNINNNPNLFAIVELLCNNDYRIDILVRKNSAIDQSSHIDKLSFYFYTNIDIPRYVVKKKYSLIFGIDQGIIDASKLSKSRKTPICLISYEIMFADEYGLLKKKKEIEACKNISFAICQDPVRSYFLSRENSIPISRIFNIPVTSDSKKRYKKSYFLYNQLNIPRDKKIALFAGSISKWSMVEDIIRQSDLWPDNWVLVLHDRYGTTHNSITSLIKNRPRVYNSAVTFNTTQELDKLICSADVGLGLYKSNFKSANEGKNLVFMGLSSGKLITYLKYGVPVITNEIGQLSDIIRENELGLVISNIGEINPAKIDTIKSCRENCVAFFKEYFDFQKKGRQILELISDSINGSIDIKKIVSFNNDFHFEYSLSHIKQIEHYFNLAKQTFNSKYYRLGYFLLNPQRFFGNNKISKKIITRLQKTCMNLKTRHE